MHKASIPACERTDDARDYVSSSSAAFRYINVLEEHNTIQKKASQQRRVPRRHIHYRRRDVCANPRDTCVTSVQMLPRVTVITCQQRGERESECMKLRSFVAQFEIN